MSDKHEPTHRRSLSGKLIPRGVQVLPTWQEIVRPPKPQAARKRTGSFYEEAAKLPVPQVVVEFPEGYRGGRHPGRQNGAHSKALRAYLGLALSRRVERTHPVRRRQRNAERVARAARRAEREQRRAEQVAA